MVTYCLWEAEMQFESDTFYNKLYLLEENIGK